MLFYNHHKGFCINDTPNLNTSHKSATFGFDLLPWAQEPIDHEQVEQEEQVENSGKKKLSKKERRNAKKEKKIQECNEKRGKRLNDNEELQNGESIPTLNRFELVTEMKRIQTKINKLYQEVAKVKAGEDCKLFQYHSIAFYKSDLEHLFPEEWLCDNNISLMYEIFAHGFIKNFRFKDQIYLLFPSLVQLFLHMPYQDSTALSSLLPMNDMKNSKFIFIPLNYMDDLEDVDLEDNNNGDHWLLAVLSLLDNKLYVYDSMISDEDDGEILKELVKRLIACKLITNPRVTIQYMKCSQQRNFDDCGVYLLMFTATLLSRMLNANSVGEDDHNLEFEDEEYPVSMDIGNLSFEPLQGRLFIMEKILHQCLENINNEK